MSDASKLFEQLSSKHRRRILVLLCERDALRIPDDVLSRGATRSAEGGRDGTVPKPSPESDLEIRLKHVELPKLAAADLVEWEPDSGTVTRGPAFERVEPSIRLLADNPHRFPPDLL
jgi:hypothetical protein